LDENEKKYSSCILKVGSRGGVYNKYAVCTSRRCSENYDLNRMPEEYKQEIIKKDKSARK